MSPHASSRAVIAKRRLTFSHSLGGKRKFAYRGRMDVPLLGHWECPLPVRQGMVEANDQVRWEAVCPLSASTSTMRTPSDRRFRRNDCKRCLRPEP